MIALHHPTQAHHNPQFFMSSGAQRPCPEKPARVDALIRGLDRLGITPQQPDDHGMDAIAAIHPDRYLTFLRHIHDRWSRIDGASAEVIPNIHPVSRNDGYPLSAVGQAGFHITDTSAPIGPNTWVAAYASAQCAIHAAELLLQGQTAYALCRPPGHHAFAEIAGGFCYLNNTAIAAQQLILQGRKVAILDIDLHHGNGTQGIFYDRPDVLTVSLHAHPERFYPFFWGYPNETGSGDGSGANLNLPMARGTGDHGF
ncbi:MAG: histone deacetylase family protein, partial [Candidatus Saccharibacteria bacterium]|nr:histone deacetylase family protein [Pseudorhodobacter sp.]